MRKNVAKVFIHVKTLATTLATKATEQTAVYGCVQQANISSSAREKKTLQTKCSWQVETLAFDLQGAFLDVNLNFWNFDHV